MNIQSFSLNDVKAEFPLARTYQELFRALEQRMSKEGKVICSFKINGHSIDENFEKRVSQASIEEIDTIEVFTQNHQELITSVIQNWIEAIPNMIEHSDDLSSAIRHQGVTGKLKDLVRFIDDAQLLVDSIISISNLFPDGRLVKSADWSELEVKTAKAIGDCLETFQKKDFVVLADVLEYDLAECLQNWGMLFEALIVELGAYDQQVKKDSAVAGESSDSESF
jgi:hypothetical protein